MKFELIEKAGLTQREFAQVCGVSRTTVNLWINGKMNPHRFILSRVQAVIDALEGALASGELPTAKRSAKDRAAFIEALVTKHLATA